MEAVVRSLPGRPVGTAPLRGRPSAAAAAAVPVGGAGFGSQADAFAARLSTDFTAATSCGCN